jgi:hypothetical protein
MTEALTTGPLGLGDLLDRSFRLVRQRWWPYELIAACLLVPYGIVSSTIATIWPPVSLPPSQEPGDLGTELALLGSLFPLPVVLDMIASNFVGLATVLALTAYTLGILHGERGELGGSLRQGLRCFWPALGLHVVVGIVTTIVLVVSLVPAALIAIVVAVAFFPIDPVPGASQGTMATIGETAIGALLVLLILVVCSVPAGFFLGRWLPALPALVAEGLGARAALGRSWRLTAGQSWRMMGYLVLLVALGFLIFLSILVARYLLSLLFGPSGQALTSGLTTGLAYITTILWLPLQTAATVLLYYDLRARREGYDLSLRVTRLEAEVSAGDAGTMSQVNAP